jgi:tetratricopeptide (TPR) repeat protein
VIGLCLLVIITLILRGLAGESLGERSLLFRYQYLVGSLRVWGANPFLGIGPGVFQDGYALLKPALSPEDVATPHNVALAWVATLGGGGLALVGFLGHGLLTHAGQSVEDQPESPKLASDQLMKIGLLIITVATLISVRMQAPVLTQAGLIPILTGLALWYLIAIAVIRSSLPDQTLRVVMLVLGGVLLVHAMIEVTGSLIVSAPLWGLGAGLALRPKRSEKRSPAGALITGTAMIGIGIIVLNRWAPINRWERSLHASAQHARVIADVHGTLNALEFASAPELLLDQSAEQLSTLLGTPIPASMDSVLRGLHQAEFLSRQQATVSLLDALEARPSHTPTRIAISQQHLWLASVLQGVGQVEQASQEWDQAFELFEDEALDTQGHRWLGSILAGRASAFRDAPERAEWLREAIHHSEIAMTRTPHDPHLAHQIMMLSIEAGDFPRAQTWADRALALHEQMRLDPIRGLSPDEIDDARPAARGP